MAPAFPRGRRPSRPQPARFLALAALAGFLVGAVLTLAPSLTWVSAPTPQATGSPERLGRSRRETLIAGVAASVAGASPAAFIGSPPASAEMAWQLKQPQDWQIFSQTPQPPPGEMKPAALVVAGRPDAGGELVVLRAPLNLSPGNPNEAAGKNLAGYFSSPSKVKIEAAIEAVASSQRAAPSITGYDVVGGSVEERVRAGRRYVRYDYQSTVCPAIITQGANGRRCENDKGELLEELDRRHAITFTVVDESTPQGPPNKVLWLVDISAPTGAWQYAKDPIADLSQSFVVGSEQQLEQDRDAYRQQLNAELEKLNTTSSS